MPFGTAILAKHKEMKVKRPVLRYHGGKWLLAKWIISHFPQHRIYTEVFGGAASVLMQKPRSFAEVYNDKWDVVVNVFRVLRDYPGELERRLFLTPFSRTEFNSCSNLHLIEDPVERARLTILRSFSGFGSASTNSMHSTGFRSNSNRSGTTPAHDWMNFPNHIKSFVERLRGVVIENRDYQDVLLKHDSCGTLHYVDPPYVHDTRNMQRGAAYACEMSDEDHVHLAQILNSLKGMVVLSGYDSELYDDLFRGWEKVSRSSHADGAADRVECLWLRNVPKMRLI